MIHKDPSHIQYEILMGNLHFWQHQDSIKIGEGMKVLLTILLSLFAIPTLANWEEDFQHLKKIPRSFEEAGAICEELAKLKLEKTYDNNVYQIVIGIEYGDSQRTIGELDIVIFDRASKMVKHIAEVKCWKNMNGGLLKARDQRLRFLANMKSKKAIHMQAVVSNERFDINQFRNIESFTTIGQKGSMQFGYDSELDYELNELQNFSMELLRCQDRGECAKPDSSD